MAEHFQVSIPFRADTGFELSTSASGDMVSVKFQSLSGLTLGLNSVVTKATLRHVKTFQSLSGLTLGLNVIEKFAFQLPAKVSIPFRADTGFEPRTPKTTCQKRCFNPFQG